MVSSIKSIFKEVAPWTVPVTGSMGGHVVTNIERTPSDAPEYGC